MNQPVQPVIENELERIVPDLLAGTDGTATLKAHIDRYTFASRYAEGRRVLDMACGVGYGSALLHRAGALSVIGVDLSEQAIAYARDRYGCVGIRFAVDRAETFQPHGPIDLAVSLETLEHVSDPRSLLARLTSLVGRGGVVIASVPTTLSTDVNPFHVHDFSANDLHQMFRDAGLHAIDEFEQTERTSAWSLLTRRRSGARQLRPGLFGWYARHPAALSRRVAHTIVHGFTNRYLTLVGQARD